MNLKHKQLTWFDDFFKELKAGGAESSAMADAVRRLYAALDETKAREEQERKKKKEQQQQEQARKEARERQAHIEQVTSMELPLDWENAFAGDRRTQGVCVDSISDGLIRCLNTLGRVDIEYIAAITGESCKSCIRALAGAIYQNPTTWEECFYKGWETAEEYLSGNLVTKWKEAKSANTAYNGYFDQNLRAIEQVLPQPLAEKEIYVTLGSPWVPPDIIDSFIEWLLGPWLSNYRGTDIYDSFALRYDEITGTWEIPEKSRYNYGRHAVRCKNTYGTAFLNALHIIERTLNMKPLTVCYETRCDTNKSGKKRVINKSETLLAMEKQQKILEKFREWIWADPKRKERLETIYEERYSCVKARQFNGSFLQFPTMSPQICLYPYQKNAVARILFSPNTLLAHDVGSGKTYIMIAAAMELRRMDIARKNLFVVPNNIIGQWRDIFLKLYPQANLLTVPPQAFAPKKRKEVLEQIRDNDYDAVLMAYSCFEMVPLSKEYYVQEIERQQKAIVEQGKKLKKSTARLKKKQEALAKRLTELVTMVEAVNIGVFFDELGINTLFVDEAHNFKNVPVETKGGQVLGISKTGSSKCRDMLDKVHCVQRQNNGRGVVFATGTPITNSVTDVYVMQKYLQNGELALLDLQSFDSWVGMFAEKKTEFEIDVDTSGYRLATRFSKFHNLPELTALLSSIADFHSMELAEDLPQCDGYTDALLAKTDGLKNYLSVISQRADSVRNGYVPRTEDNMLKITTDGRKAALDLRLVQPHLGAVPQSKVYRCAENVAHLYWTTQAQRSTQLVFCDSSTPKKEFNIYDELKRLLVQMGVPAEQVAYVHHATTEKKREELFAQLRRGEIRILIGSTFKLGLGVNIQDRLIALHHLDVPWRPADMVQREGRILRQGNQNAKVQIFRYITEGSFDAYSWQLLETKQRFIVDLLSGSMTQRSGSDIDDTVLDYAEVKALAVGNPLIKERVEKANELTRYRTLHRKAVETAQMLEAELRELPARLQNQQRLIENCKADLPRVAQDKQDPTQRRALRKQIFDALVQNELSTKEQAVASYRGFTVVLPANMKKEKPFVWVQQKGRYYVEMGDTEMGVLTRIDFFLDHLPRHLEKLTQGLQNLQERQRALADEIKRTVGYTEEIALCQRQLEEIDKKLGVNKNE